jgi:hypothetical protein
MSEYDAFEIIVDDGGFDDELTDPGQATIIGPIVIPRPPAPVASPAPRVLCMQRGTVIIPVEWGWPQAIVSALVRW